MCCLFFDSPAAAAGDRNLGLGARGLGLGTGGRSPERTMKHDIHFYAIFTSHTVAEVVLKGDAMRKTKKNRVLLF